MENASKALLIAASILIAILLIAMGVRVFKSTSGTVDTTESTMKSAEVAQFNGKFLQYVGVKSGAQVISLLNLAIANNATNDHDVYINGHDPKAIQIGQIGPSTTYTISIGDSEDYYDEKGFIINISVSGLIEQEGD